jgi:hypothetical protein
MKTQNLAPVPETGFEVEAIVTSFSFKCDMGFQVITAASMKKTVFWVVAPCILSLMMEAASTSETSVNFYQTTRRNNLEDSHLQVWLVLGRF